MDELPKLPLSDSKKRNGYVEWDEHFIATTLLRAGLDHGNDPGTNTALVLNRRQIIIGLASDGKSEGNEGENGSENHAETRAISEACTFSRRPNSAIYTIFFPCKQCAKSIIGNGIKEVIYMKDTDCDSNRTTKEMFEAAKVQIRKFIPRINEVVLDLQQGYHLPPTP